MLNNEIHFFLIEQIFTMYHRGAGQSLALGSLSSYCFYQASLSLPSWFLSQIMECCEAHIN